MPPSEPQVAQCEEYDSDDSCVKPGTRTEARRKTTNSRPPKALDRYRTGPRDAASDSGYSSHTSGTQASNVPATAKAPPANQMPPPPRPATAQPGNRGRPVLHGNEHQRSKEKVPTRSASHSRQNGPCDDLNCQHPPCMQVRHAQRRFSNSHQQTGWYAPHYTASPSPYQQPQPQQPQQPYQYAPVSTPGNTVPTLSAQPRPRAITSRQARPVSIHGYPPQTTYSNEQGPPPAHSAYQNLQYAAWYQAYHQQQQYQAYQQQMAAAYPTAPQTSARPAYPQLSPLSPSPTSPNFTTGPMLQRTYSARAGNNYEPPQQYHQPNSSNRPYSARQPLARTSTMPGTYPDDTRDSSPSSSEESESGSEFSDEEYERDRRARARDSRLMSSSSGRRPSMKRQYVTAPVVPTTSSRDLLPRNPRSDSQIEHTSSSGHRRGGGSKKSLREMLHRNTHPESSGLDYISSSDNHDSDRTARAVVDRSRGTYTSSSKSSRRPSVSTTASSGRTKATTVSSSSGIGNVVVERNGRNISYLSKVDRAAYVQKQLEEQQRLEDAIEAYQSNVKGNRSPEVTSDNIRGQYLNSEPVRSSAPSRRSSKSSRRHTNSEGVKIETGGTVIHVHPGSKVEMRSGGDGISTFVIGTTSGRERSEYRGRSKSSAGRTRVTDFDNDTSSIPSLPSEAIPEEYSTEQREV